MGHPEMIGWVLAASGFGSAIGGTLYGALPRGASTALLLVFLGTLTALPALSRGWQGSCLNGGTALAAPLIGAIMDATGWQWGFLVAGIAGAVIGATVWTAERVVRKRQAV